MTSILGYCDPLSVASGETVRFMVSCHGADAYEAEVTETPEERLEHVLEVIRRQTP